jgi:hypothetical protein
VTLGINKDKKCEESVHRPLWNRSVLKNINSIDTIKLRMKIKILTLFFHEYYFDNSIRIILAYVFYNHKKLFIFQGTKRKEQE